MNVRYSFVSTFNALNNWVFCIIESITNLSINVNIRDLIELAENAKKMLLEINEFLFEVDEVLFETKRLWFKVEKVLFKTKKIEIEMLREINVDDIEILLFNLINVNTVMYWKLLFTREIIIIKLRVVWNAYCLKIDVSLSFLLFICKNNSLKNRLISLNEKVNNIEID